MKKMSGLKGLKDRNEVFGNKWIFQQDGAENPDRDHQHHLTEE